MIALPLVVHPGELPPEGAVDWVGDLQFIETAWNLPVPDARPLPPPGQQGRAKCSYLRAKL